MDGDIRLPPVGCANGYWWVRAGSIKILELCGIDRINPPLRTRTGECVDGDSIVVNAIDRVFRGNFPRPSAKIDT